MESCVSVGFGVRVTVGVIVAVALVLVGVEVRVAVAGPGVLVVRGWNSTGDRGCPGGCRCNRGRPCNRWGACNRWRAGGRHGDRERVQDTCILPVWIVIARLGIERIGPIYYRVTGPRPITRKQ